MRPHQSSDNDNLLAIGKIKNCDAAFYIVCQFIGGLLGALAASAVLSSWVSVGEHVVNPGRAGVFAAFLAEILMR